jgi:hypothetical protein
MNDVATPMPQYQCHKKVWALKIATLKRDGEGEDRETDGSAMITPAEKGYAPFRVDADFMFKHKPQAGGYYVVYDDGYKSFSPAKAFEEGYTIIPHGQRQA